MRVAVAVAVILSSRPAVADPLPVRWGTSYACQHCALSGPYKHLARSKGQTITNEKTLTHPPRPFRVVRVERTTAGEGSGLDLAVQVKGRWYLRNLGEAGYDTWPHGEPRIHQEMTIDAIVARDIVAGGGKEIVVVTTLLDELHQDSHRDVWVFSVDHGVPVSLNPIDGVDPATLVP